MKAYKIKLSQALSVADPTGYLLDVSNSQYAKNPEEEHLVPANQFWMKRYNWKVITEMTPVDADLDAKGKLVEKKKEVKNAVK